MKKLTRNIFIAFVVRASALAQAADAEKPAVTVFTNVKVFNGSDDKLIDGNPLEDIKIMDEPHNKFNIIMKDGKIYKNTL